jgi:hypothetical protein
MSEFDNIEDGAWETQKSSLPKASKFPGSKSHKWLIFNHEDFLPPHVYNVLFCQIANDMCIFV